MALSLTYAETKKRDALSPQRRRSYKQQLDPVRALFEACDNVIAAGYERNYKEFRLDIQLDGDAIIFKDNVGGLSKDDWPKLVDTWESEFAMDSPTPSMNAVGGLIAAYVLEADYHAFTKRDGQEAYGVHAKEGVREAHIIEDIPTHLEPDDGQTIVYYDDPNQAILPSDETLVEELGIRYQQWLRDNSRADITITVNGRQVSPPSRPSFVGTPFHFPRQYRFKHPNRSEEPVCADVTVGLADDSEKGGIDLYYQGVCINMCSDSAGDIASQLESAFNNHPRLRIVIDFWSADSTQLPWNRDKTTVKTRNPVWKEISDWIARAARSYARLQHLQEFKEVQDAYLDAGWPGNVSVKSYDNPYVVGENERLKSDENPTWGSDRKEDVEKIISHAEEQARALVIDPSVVTNKIELPTEVDKQEFEGWFRNLVISIANDSNTGLWKHEQPVDDKFSVADFELDPDTSPDATSVDNTVYKAKTDKQYRRDNQNSYDGWKATVYETVHNNTDAPTTTQQTNTSQVSTANDTEGEQEGAQPNDGKNLNEERAKRLVPDIKQVLDRQHNKIRDYDGTLSEKDEVTSLLFPGQSRDDIRHSQLTKTTQHSQSTSLGTFYEHVAMQFEAQEIPDEQNVGRRGARFDIQTTQEQGTYIIQMKTSVDSMNVDNAESLAESLAVVEQNDDDSRKPRLAIVFGSFAEIPRRVEDAIKEHEGLEQDWEEYVLIDETLWNLVTGDGCDKDDVYDVYRNIGTLIEKDDDVDSDISTAIDDRLDTLSN